MHAYKITDTSIQEKEIKLVKMIGYRQINVHCRKKFCKEIKIECIIKV